MFEDNRKLRLEQEGLFQSSFKMEILYLIFLEMAKRAAEIKTKREAMRLLRNITGETSKTSELLTNSSYQPNDFLKVFIEQQKLVQQQELEHKQKLQQEQQVYI